MRICLLTTQDLDADPFPADDWPCDPRPYLPDAEWHVGTLYYGRAEEQVRALAAEDFDLFFNLCDGAEAEKRPGIEVVRTLEALEVPFTGATSNYYEPTRLQMKEACRSQGIDAPRGLVVASEEEVEQAASELSFPLFVKHHNSYASVDLSRRSRVRTPAGLRIQAHKMISRHGAALVEEYIAGIECTVLVAENADDPARPITYTPMQYRFPAGEDFKHADLKWVTFADMDCVPVEDPTLNARLRDAAAGCFLGLEGASFGRCDFRVDATGRPFLLEINPNCGVYYPPNEPGSADLCLQHDPAGHAGFTRHLVRAALARHARRQDGHSSAPD
jgi:D-alanine-D-alanine ligase